MRRMILSCAATVSVAAMVSACGGDDVFVAPPPADAGASKDGGADAKPGDATAGDATEASVPPPVDAGTDAQPTRDGGADGGDAAGTAAVRLLLSAGTTGASELVAVNVATGNVDGRLAYPADFGGTYTGGPAPWLLEQSIGGGGGAVARLDGTKPWVIDSQWNLSTVAVPDGGATYADPEAVVVSAGKKAYVILYTRNEIAIIDPSQSTDAGVPTGTIDLSGYVNPNDSDGRVEPTAGVYDETRGLVYVLLGNVDQSLIPADGAYTGCTASTPAIIAIDTTTDSVVSLTGGDAKGELPLPGYNPGQGLPLTYDKTNDRLLVLEDGCNPVLTADAGLGPLEQREIDQVSLFTGEASELLDENADGFPSGFAYIGPNRAIVQFDFTGSEVYLWDPAQASLGPLVANAPDAWVWDGADNLLGMVAGTNADGGSVTNVVSVRIADGKQTVLLTNPFSVPGVYPEQADLWPRP